MSSSFDGLSQDTLAKLSTLAKSNTTTGISTGTNLLYYNLEPLARRLYPVWFPLLDSIPRKKSDTPGAAIHWKAITAVSIGDPGVSEGNRNAFMSFTEQDYIATYKYLGGESYVTFPAQYGSQGFDDAVGIANTNRLMGLMNAEEKVTLFGNSGNGTGNNGFQFASAPTIASATAVTTPTGASSITATNLVVYVAPVTAWGASANPIAVGSGLGLLTSSTRTNADGSTDTIYGGVGKLSAASSNVAPSAQSVQVVVNPIPGAVAYAVYVSLNASPTTANAYFCGIYPSSTFIINGNGSSAPTGYSTSNQAANATGLTADNSANPLHFDGLFTWAVTGGYTKDFAGAGLTPDGNGGIEEIETVLKYFWDTYKLTPDAIIIGGSALMDSFARCVLTGGTDAATRVFFSADKDGQVGGQMVREYRAKYTGGAAKIIKIELHPWAPAGTIYFDLRSNPYPESNVAAPREFDVMADHFSVYWPLRSLKWEVGTYVFETLKHYVPFGTALLTSVGSAINAVA